MDRRKDIEAHSDGEGDRSPHTAQLPGDVVCPFCDCRDSKPMATFGSLLMTSQYYCNVCRTPFEWVRRESDRRRPGACADEKK